MITIEPVIPGCTEVFGYIIKVHPPELNEFATYTYRNEKRQS
jgi:hypothetical protein